VNILITGATGFIGKRLSQRLIKENHTIVCTGRSLSKLDSLREKADIVYMDIENPSSVNDIIKKYKPEAVFHCAAKVDGSSLEELIRSNVYGTENVLKASFEEGVERVIYLSSIAVISGNPQIPLTEDLPYAATNKYGTSKVEAEKIALDYRRKGLKISIIRPSMVYGEGEPHLLSLLVKLIKWRLLPIIGKGENKLHLVAVDNLIDVMMIALSRDQALEGTYIVADKEVLSIDKFFNIIAQSQGAKSPYHIHEKFIPILEKIPFIGKRVLFFKKDRIYSIDSIKEKLNYTPRVSVYEGLKKAVKSYLRE